MSWYMTDRSGAGLPARPVFAASLLVVCGTLCAQQPQPTMHLSLADAEKLAVQNNPQLSSAHYTAAAAHQVPNQYKANLAPNVFGSFTGVGADNGSRLAAGGLNNPIVYNRLGSGLTVGQLITDFGRTSDLVGSARLRADAQDQATEATRARIELSTAAAYFAVLRAHAVLRVAEQTVKARQDVADQVAALAESKMRTTLDVSFANVNLSDARLLVVQAQGRSIGLLADECREFLLIPSSAVHPPGEALAGISAHYIAGIATIGDRMIVVLNVDELLNTQQPIVAA